MKIVMKESVPGSVDGINTAVYEARHEYDLTGSDGERDLAAAFVGAGFAEEVKAKSASPAVVTEAAAGDADAASAAAEPALAAKLGRRAKAQ